LAGRRRAAPQSAHYADTRPGKKFEGLAISDRFWSKLRRNGAGDPTSADPRPLKYLLKQVDKATQVRRSGLDQVVVELNLHRDSTPSPELKSALAWLCNSLSRMVSDPNAAHSREVLVAADAVKRASA
jgi:hypothetical protein